MGPLLEELVGAKAPGLIIEAVLWGSVGLGVRLGMKGEGAMEALMQELGI